MRSLFHISVTLIYSVYECIKAIKTHNLVYWWPRNCKRMICIFSHSYSMETYGQISTNLYRFCAPVELNDYHDSICYHDSLGLFMNKIIDCLIIGFYRILASLTVT